MENLVGTEREKAYTNMLNNVELVLYDILSNEAKSRAIARYENAQLIDPAYEKNA